MLLILKKPQAGSKVLFAPAEHAQPATQTIANLIPPHAFEVPSIAQVKAEIFGPVLQVVRWSGEPSDVVQQINALGYGLSPKLLAVAAISAW